MNGFAVVIPARYASTRLPAKPLADINGRPMVVHVWERAREAGAAVVAVATDSDEIRAVCERYGARVVMTSALHQSGTDRINEAVRILDLADDAIVVNLQGDEPMMPPENIRQVAELAARPHTDIATLHVPVKTLEEYVDPNVVKLVLDNGDRALYFSRAPIPWYRDGERDADGRLTAFAGAMRHLGIYAYRVSALARFSAASPCTLEMVEKLEQLRALWLGMTVRSAMAAHMPPRGVDTLDDLENVRAMLSGTARDNATSSVRVHGKHLQVADGGGGFPQTACRARSGPDRTRAD